MAEQRSAERMVENILSSNKLTAEVQSDPASALKQAAMQAIAESPLQGDRLIYRMVVCFLGCTITIVTIGSIYLAMIKADGDTPDSIVALGSAAIGALAGLLAPSPNR